MAPLLRLLRILLATFPQMLLSGGALVLLLAAVLLVLLQYRRVATMEAELFGVAKHSPMAEVQRSFFYGLLGGVIGSLLFSLAGVGLVTAPGTASALLYLWPVSILLGMLNPRFICFAYSATILSLSSLVFGWPRIDVASTIGLVAVLHMVEALLVWISGASCATPMSLHRANSTAIPGFMLQRFWPVPLILPIFSLAGGGLVDMPAWWPLLRPEISLVPGGGVLGWGLLPVVVTMGYSDLAISASPEVRARQSSGVLLAYSALLFLLAVGAAHFRPLAWVAALASGFGHEAMAVWSGRVQLLGVPYLRPPTRGVGVLDVLPGSPAEAAGLRTGAVILMVDDFEVHTRDELHQALMRSPAVIRLQYRTGRQLEQSRLLRPAEGLFAFGAILLPEPGEKPIAKTRRPAFFRWSGLEK